ncbi:MAG: aldo/keto reductase [Deltaproteobacteria bacterium]|nr:aldo/keto reductase [Deltaproteobacteria bacterium]
MTQPGWATEEGTANYRRRFQGKNASDHYRQHQGLWLSSIGIGTYLGNHDATTDELYQQAVVRTVELGSNVIDSAINYRFQRSERSIAAALKELATKGIERSDIVIATKGGFIPFDGSPPHDIRSYFDETFVKPGIANFSDVVAGCHCMTPSYLLNQLDCSLKNLDIECIDIYYVHNPETQLAKVSRGEFNDRLLKAFETLEGAVSAGKIRLYGTATWNGYRNDAGAKDYLSLAEVVEIAKKAGGEKHHFKIIQLPLNLAMPEALTKRNQEVDGEKLSTLEAAQRLGIAVMSSASILQGQLSRDLLPRIGEVFAGFETDAQRSLQFVRSTPGVTVALVGMKQISHVEENLKVTQVPAVSWEQYAQLFKES